MIDRRLETIKRNWLMSVSTFIINQDIKKRRKIITPNRRKDDDRTLQMQQVQSTNDVVSKDQSKLS